MKVYVDSQEEDFICDSFLADNTRLISEFHHEESELEYTECKLLDLADHDKQVKKQICEKINAELYNKMVLYNKKLEYSDIALILDQIQGE